MSLTSIPPQPICLFGRREIPVKTPCQGCEVSVRRHVGFTSSSRVFHVFLTDQEEEVKQPKPLLLLTSFLPGASGFTSSPRFVGECVPPWCDDRKIRVLKVGEFPGKNSR